MGKIRMIKLVALLMALTMTLTLAACKKNKDGEGNETSGSAETTVAKIVPEIRPMTFDITVKQGGFYFYEFFFDNADEIKLTKEMVTLPEGLSATVELIKSTLDEELQTICLSEIAGESGLYTITIADGAATNAGTPSESATFDVYLVSEDTSNYISLNCVSSNTTVPTGGTFTITGKYTGISSSKYMKYNMSEDYIKLHNCTADLRFTRVNNNLSTCIIVSNVAAIDSSEVCKVEILDGSAVDMDGKPVNGYTVEFTVE